MRSVRKGGAGSIAPVMREVDQGTRRSRPILRGGLSADDRIAGETAHSSTTTIVFFITARGLFNSKIDPHRLGLDPCELRKPFMRLPARVGECPVQPLADSMGFAQFQDEGFDLRHLQQGLLAPEPADTTRLAGVAAERSMRLPVGAALVNVHDTGMDALGYAECLAHGLRCPPQCAFRR